MNGNTGMTVRQTRHIQELLPAGASAQEFLLLLVLVLAWFFGCSILFHFHKVRTPGFSWKTPERIQWQSFNKIEWFSVGAMLTTLIMVSLLY